MDFDWKAHLRHGERLLWTGRHKTRGTAWLALPVLGVFLVLPYFNDGSDRIQVAVAAAPWIVAFILVSLVVMAFRQNYYALTNMRALSATVALWHGARLKSIELGDADVVKHPRTPLMFVDRRTRKPAVSMSLSNGEAAKVMAMAKDRNA
jgi:hypothetical protein